MGSGGGDGGGGDGRGGVITLTHALCAAPCCRPGPSAPGAGAGGSPPAAPAPLSVASASSVSPPGGQDGNNAHIVSFGFFVSYNFHAVVCNISLWSYIPNKDDANNMSVGL